MAAENRFHYRRLDEMDSVRIYNKRKRFDPPFPFRHFEGRDRESLLLGPLDKKMKSAPWGTPLGVGFPNFSLLPKSVQSLSHRPSSSMKPLLAYSRRKPLNEILSAVRSHWTNKFLQRSDLGAVPSTASKLERVPLEHIASSSGNSTPPSSHVEFRVRSRLESGQDDFEFHSPSYAYNSKGIREVSEYLNRAHAQSLKDDISVEKYTELLHSSPSGISAKSLSLADGRMHGNSLEQRSEPARDDTSLASLSDNDEPARAQWKVLHDRANNYLQAENMKALQDEIGSLEARLEGLRFSRPPAVRGEKEPAEDPKLIDAFTPLTSEAERKVNEALRGSDRDKILVLHEKSNIEVTRTVMQCLLPGAWLNDEVINVYMELLKEREASGPDRFLKCHFFNTFFYNKLYKDKRSYDYKAIRRWTTQRKLGYSLSDCDKILVPIHQDIHWCLAVINVRDKKLEYLDSLKGSDRAVLNILAKYISDEARDKDGKDLDTANWDLEYPHSIPEQLNGCDCGMFMLKYADFHSRDAPLQFTQEDMPYFRKKMVWEILNLKAT